MMKEKVRDRTQTFYICFTGNSERKKKAGKRKTVKK